MKLIMKTADLIKKLQGTESVYVHFHLNDGEPTEYQFGGWASDVGIDPTLPDTAIVTVDCPDLRVEYRR